MTQPPPKMPDAADPAPPASWAPTLPAPLDAVALAAPVPCPTRGAARPRLDFGATVPTPLAADAALVASTGAASALRIVVKGLKPTERQLLVGTVKLSQRRTPRLELLDDVHAHEADIVLVDTRDADAVAWSQQQVWLAAKPVIWIDGNSVPEGHATVRRPVQWPVLPMLLARLLEQCAGTRPVPVARVAPAAPPALPQPAQPTPPEVAAKPVPRAPEAPVAPARPPVLIVDDSLAVRAYLRSLLEAVGFTVSEAVDAQAALERVGREPFAAVLLDVLMPGIDGYEACRRIKSRQRGTQGLPVIMLTSKSSPFDRIRGKMAGCNAYLTKPVDPQELANVLARYVHGVQPRAGWPAPVAHGLPA